MVDSGSNALGDQATYFIRREACFRVRTTGIPIETNALSLQPN